MDVLEGNGEQSTPGRPRKRSFKRALELQKEFSPPRGHITVDDLINREINVDTIYWLDKVNGHLEKHLKKENRDNNMKIHMSMHYYIRNRVSQVRIKHLKKKLKETLTSQKDKEKLDLLVEASLMA